MIDNPMLFEELQRPVKTPAGSPTLNSGRMVGAQGLEANSAGKHLEDIVESTMRRFGFHVIQYSQSAGNLDLLHSDLLIKNYPYRSIYETNTRCEFVICSARLGVKIRVECKWQEHRGSVDEKFPYFLENAKRAEQDEVIIVVDGDGYRGKALEWLKRSARAAAKKIHVFNIKEFIRWANRFSR